ncbi:pilus assembly protein PilO [Planococcus antarcticus DSM 14505]|uniref:Pilus assembly protein PilO n=1 Tax=Planococcus antarcticus DSM 14505 TaxID=1185653 RepID=A0ABM6D8T4_9BACL|nr:pilus assembly protein PilO [Planococcus antarcticus]ANU11312.1 pilus assembly protein PilO [Planococcus antarcticus DSM 14505]
MSSLSKSQKEKGLIFLSVIFLLALAAYSYFSLYAPAKESRLQAEQTLSSERDVLVALQAQLKELPEGEKISTSDLQQKVSVESLTEQIVLQIEQAELISDTLVDNIGITEGLVEMPVPVEGLENLQEVLTTVTIKADDYQEITTFITEVEAMERIMIVEAVDFGSNEEITSADQVGEPIDVNLTFSAYFRPDLIALADTLPKIDAPAPAGKINPLPQNDGTDLAEELEVDPDVDIDVEVNVEENAAALDEE